MDFPRVRTTRTNKTKVRATRKQTGGAPSYTPNPVPKYFTEDVYKAKWAAKLNPELVRLLTDPTLSAAVGKAYSPEYYSAWLDAIKHQDRIYRSGLEIIIEDLTIKTDKDEQYSDILAKIKSNTLPKKPDVVSLFTTLEHILSLSHGSNFKAGGDPTNKFEHMFKTRLLTQKSPTIETEMANLLLNPKRIENILVQNVASIVVMLKEANNLQDIIPSLANPILKDALIKKWMFFSIHGTELQTNEDVRDAFLTGSEPCKNREILQFWTAFVEELGKGQGSVDATEFPFEDNYVSYGTLAAKMAKSQNLLADIAAVARPDLDYEQAAKDSIPDGIEASPVGGIFKKLVPNLVFFLKHLEGAVEEVTNS